MQLRIKVIVIALSQRGLAVIDMGDDAEVTDVGHSNRKNRFLIDDEFDRN
jgi:hypothetical protein